jgi:hypothetical protein
VEFRQEAAFAAFHAQVVFVEMDGLSLHEWAPYGQVFGGCLIVFAVTEPHAVAMHLHRIAAGDYADQDTAVQQAVAAI